MACDRSHVPLFVTAARAAPTRARRVIALSAMLGTLLVSGDSLAQQVIMRRDSDGKVTFTNGASSAAQQPHSQSVPSRLPPVRPGLAPRRMDASASAPIPQRHSFDYITVAGGGASFQGSILALKPDGTVWQWGRTVAPMAKRVCEQQVPGLVNVKALSIGNEHAVALMRDGSVWTWGMNNNYELGDQRSASGEPARLTGIDQVKGVAAGGHHTLALRDDGTVWTWGQNIFGQLGDGTSGRANMSAKVTDPIARLKQEAAQVKTKRSNPAPVAGLDHVTAVAAGNSHSVALKDDGSVWAWGYNGKGQLGIGTTEPVLTPTQVKGLDEVTAITCGVDFCAALRRDGRVWAWGANDHGQLGDASHLNQSKPVPIEGLAGVVKVAAGGLGGVVIREDTTVWVWGVAFYAPQGASSPQPTQVADIHPIKAAAIAAGRSVVVRQDGSVWFWGTQPGFVAPSYDDNGRAASSAFQRQPAPLCGPQPGASQPG